MSVKVCDRKQGRFETLTKSMELASHTIKVCDNSNIFPKRHRLSITADIIKETKWLPKLINRANKKDLLKETKERKKLQRHALDLLDDIEIDLQITYLALSPNISEQKLDYWIGLVVETRTKLNAWIKADNEELKRKG